ncbi:MAG: hypothetical protein L6Q84_28515 [Polyangiaceae bacterium]|nr:hypothetical protein [Polyangiaceae bacterium]
MTSKTENTFDDRLLDVNADGALAALAGAGPALVDAWVKRGNAAAVAEVAERGEGPARKAARRGIGVLKSRGVPVPEKTRTATLAGPAKQEVHEAWMMPPDSVGNSLLVVASHAGASRYKTAFVVINDSLGVHRVDVGEQSLSQLKATMTKALPGAPCKPLQVPVGWVRHRIAAARKRHAERGVPEPLGFTSARSLLEPVPEAAPPHPFDEEGLEVAQEDAMTFARTSASLHSLPEFRGWFPSQEAVEEMLVKVGETVPAGEQPDPEKLKAALETEIVAATDRYFSPERRAELVRAMKDSALSVLARDGEQKALEVSATMTGIESRGLITDAPHEVGFLKGFFEKAISLLLARGGGSLRIPVRAAPPQPAEAAAEATAEPGA